MTDVHSKEVSMKQTYVAPSLKVLGSLTELTLRHKVFGRPTDGDFFSYRSLGNVS
jgi:hypothetical protein